MDDQRDVVNASSDDEEGEVEHLYVVYLEVTTPITDSQLQYTPTPSPRAQYHAPRPRSSKRHRAINYDAEFDVVSDSDWEEDDDIPIMHRVAYCVLCPSS
jgi:hypothetical protein